MVDGDGSGTCTRKTRPIYNGYGYEKYGYGTGTLKTGMGMGSGIGITRHIPILIPALFPEFFFGDKINY